ncbi:hypothetical protein EDB95_4364 [Dinghuibacter silviterrae]|uniref:Uncharacterized protein n=2 Tax=Dinghuibacter silviterrae TaxID=1539049 RepID=A0A4R8DFZ3_9BACT|nr:hypothetical protein EDB95_4364 [Dinghuibacter silviterrae]
MELDQLKDSWRQLDDAPPLRVDLPALLQKAERAAAGPLRRMKRNVLLQSVTLVIVYVLAYTQFQGPERIPVGVFYLLMILTAGVYYGKKYRLLKNMENIRADEDLLTNFTHQLERFKSLIGLELWITYMLLLLVMWFVCWLLWAYQRHDFYSFLGLPLHRGQEALVVGGWTLCAFALMVPGHYVTIWYNQRRYGRHIDALEKTLQELEQ